MPRGSPGQAPRPGEKGGGAADRAIRPAFIGESARFPPAFGRRQKDEPCAGMRAAYGIEPRFGPGNAARAEPDRDHGPAHLAARLFEMSLA